MTEGTTVEVTVAPEVATQKADEPASSVPENLVAPDPTANVVETPADTEKPQDTAVVEEPQDGAKSVEEDVPIKLPDSASKEVDESVQGVSGVVIQSVTSEVDTTLQPESVAEEIPSILPKQAEGVKVFVGILPRTVADEELRKVFESAGPLVALYVGLDKRNITLKFAILTYRTAEAASKAIEAFNGQKPFPTIEGPLIVKLADHQSTAVSLPDSSTLTLFVRRITVDTTKEELEALFSAYGKISDIIIARKPVNPNFPSGEVTPGYALVKIDSRENGEAAIKALNNTHRVEGSTYPLEVRWGKEQTGQRNAPAGGSWDFRKRKAEEELSYAGYGGQYAFGGSAAAAAAAAGVKRAGFAPAPVPGGGRGRFGAGQFLARPPRPYAASGAPGMAAYYEAPAGGVYIPAGGIIPAGAATYAGAPGPVYLTPAQATGADYGYASAAYATGPHMAVHGQYAPPQQAGITGQEQAAPQGQLAYSQDYYSTPGQAAAYSAYDTTYSAYSAEGYQIGAVPTPAVQPSAGGTPYDPSAAAAAAASATYGASSGYTAIAPGAAAAVGTGRGYEPQQEGPTGANLFVSNIPPEFGDNELKTAFAPYGNIVSAKVFIDKTTGMSRNFGFVSYDNSTSADNAIKMMDGFSYGHRQLKVQHKRGNAGR